MIDGGENRVRWLIPVEHSALRHSAMVRIFQKHLTGHFV
jgi:hypothetical protein